MFLNVRVIFMILFNQYFGSHTITYYDNPNFFKLLQTLCCAYIHSFYVAYYFIHYIEVTTHTHTHTHIFVIVNLNPCWEKQKKKRSIYPYTALTSFHTRYILYMMAPQYDICIIPLYIIWLKL